MWLCFQAQSLNIAIMDIITFTVPNNKQSDDKDVSSQPPAPA